MSILLRVMCWNIAEGNIGSEERNAKIGSIGAYIRSKAPDIVSLSRVLCNWFSNWLRLGSGLQSGWQAG